MFSLSRARMSKSQAALLADLYALERLEAVSFASRSEPDRFDSAATAVSSSASDLNDSSISLNATVSSFRSRPFIPPSLERSSITFFVDCTSPFTSPNPPSPDLPDMSGIFSTSLLMFSMLRTHSGVRIISIISLTVWVISLAVSNDSRTPGVPNCRTISTASEVVSLMLLSFPSPTVQSFHPVCRADLGDV